MSLRFRSRALSLALTLAVVLASALYLSFQREQLVLLAKLEAAQVALLFASTAGFFVCIGSTFYLLVKMLSVELSPVEWLGLTFINTAVNYLGPVRPGIVAKAAYLKHKKRMSYSRFSSVLAANGFLLFLYSGVAGLVLLSVGWSARGKASYILALVCAVLVVVGMLPLWARISQVRRQGRIWSLINNGLQGFEEIRHQRGKILLVGALVVGQYLFAALCNYTAYRALGREVDLLTALFIGVFTSISNFFTLTPNNLGLQEVVMAYLCTISGMDFSSGFLGAGLVRAAHVVLTFTLAPVFARLLFRSARLSPAAVGSQEDQYRSMRSM